MIRILLTGATGFIGRHSLAALRATAVDAELVGLSRARPDDWPDDVAHCAVDLFDRAALRATLAQLRPTHLLHTAWSVPPGAFWTSADNLDWVAASLDLARAFAAAGGQRMVGVGSCAEYAWGGDPLAAGTTPLLPATLYGEAKRSLGQMLLAAASQLGISVAWGRLYYLYGPGEAPGRLVSDAIASLARGDTFRCGAPHLRRDYLHAGDAGRALVAMLLHDRSGAVDVASGDAPTLGEIVSCVARQLNATDRLDLAPPPAVADPVPLIRGDVATLTGVFGVRHRFSLDQGIADAIGHWTAAGWRSG